MSRLQLALNVSDLDAAVGFYSRLFSAEPAKLRPGYANFAIAEPPLKLVLVENQEGGATLNHLGVEVGSPDEVTGAAARLRSQGMDVEVREGEVCCYARQDKLWVADPDGAPWEVYTVTDEAPEAAVPEAACCA